MSAETDVDGLTPADEAMLARCLNRFKTRVTLIRMGIPMKTDHPVSDDEYRNALDQADGNEGAQP